MRKVDLKYAAISLSICALIALVISRFSRLPFVVAFLMAIGAMLVNGLIATYEDDTPGGFNNPDGKSTPSYVSTVNRVIYWVPLGAAILLAVYSLFFAHSIIVGGISFGLVAAILTWTILVKRRR